MDYSLPHEFGHRYPLITHGKGVYVFDEDGKRYLDAASGVGVVSIGHAVQEVVEAIKEQAEKLAFTYGGIVENRPQYDLASRVQNWTPNGMGETRTLFSSGGAEANEAALKLAYQYHCERGKHGKRKIVGRWQSYHGNTIGALSMSGRTQWRTSHDVYLLNFPHISPPYSYRYPGKDEERAFELEKVIKQEGPDNIAAFIAEPVIGTSMSAIVPSPEYYSIIRDICDNYDVLFIADEVLSGFGRTGTSFAIDLWNVTPDIITAGKGISSGYAPLSATILSEKVWKQIQKGTGKVSYTSTYGGNPLSCATGISVLDYIAKNSLVERSRLMGDKLIKQLREKLGPLRIVGDVRGKGLFIGIEFVSDKKSKAPFPSEFRVTERIVAQALKEGLIVIGGVVGLVDGVAGDHIEVITPFVITDEDIDYVSNALIRSIEFVSSELPSNS